tara:strand:- start:1741 stop:2031 length:291 start_codon:yes stop_codon:yes gene_type:complete
MRNKILILTTLLIIVSSCTGISGKRSEKSDEFLIEKKNPLVMPPDIDDLPKPKDSAEVKKTEDNFKETLKSNNESTNNTSSNSSGSLQESIIKKIE